MAEQSHRFVGARQHKLGLGNAPGFLLGNIAGQPVDLRRVNLAIAQGEGGIPGFGNDPIRALIVGKFVRKGDKRVSCLWPARPVGGDANASIVDVEDRPVDNPPLGLEAAKQHPHEAEAALMKGTHARQTHHRLRRPQRRLPEIAGALCFAAVRHGVVQSWCRRNAASSRP